VFCVNAVVAGPEDDVAPECNSVEVGLGRRATSCWLSGDIEMPLLILGADPGVMVGRGEALAFAPKASCARFTA